MVDDDFEDSAFAAQETGIPTYSTLYASNYAWPQGSPRPSSSPTPSTWLDRAMEIAGRPMAAMRYALRTLKEGRDWPYED